LPESDLIRPSTKSSSGDTIRQTIRARLRAGASDTYSIHIQELGPTLLSLTHPCDDVTWFRARSRVARCEVRYNREKVLLVEIGYSLGHQRAPFSRSGAVLEVIELPEHVAG
jgi:hypothetical protein